ncbi:peptidyl-alpha-hydroxyglycine alpha-amidating lyase family protein [Candidatus Bathyarchaeota archaeon]|nr:peptidyl-alpha-hydroxyglycine alpha-amidating lyase family protein [Candidatus Bathyarchaeota archaeon]
MTYEVIEGWGRLPDGWTFTQVAGVAVDSRGRVHVLCRGEHPIIVFGADGEFVESWGEGTFCRAHGAYIDGEDNFYCVDDGDHTVRKFSRDGELVFALGTEDRPAGPGEPFNRPTDVALAPNGDLYISDGYANSRVHRYSRDGELIQSWGEPGTGPGQFNLPHGVWVEEGRVYVADRQNGRIQVFTLGGGYVEEWPGLARPCDIYIDGSGLVYVAELMSRVSILNLKGEVLARMGGEKNFAPGQFVAPHCLWKDSRGSLYVGEVLEGQRIQKFVPA